jgi:hypothetical protein
MNSYILHPSLILSPLITVSYFNVHFFFPAFYTHFSPFVWILPGLYCTLNAVNFRFRTFVLGEWDEFVF